jgi:iron complex outermembrane receptor protein
VRDRIGLTGNITVSDAFGDRAALTALGVVDAASLGQVRYFTNGFKTRTQGVDIVLTHRGDVGPGSLNSSLALNYNRTRVLERRQVVLAKLRPADTRVITLIDDVRKTDIEGILPRWRAVAASTFSTDRFDFTARANYHSSFTVGATTANGGDKTFGGELSFDFEAGATFNEVYRVAIGLENAFNRYPDRETRGIFPTIDAPGSGNRYPDASPLGYQGGFWYVRVGARF